MITLAEWWKHGNPLFGNDWRGSPRAEPPVTFVPTPIGVECVICGEEVQEGDTGELMRAAFDPEREWVPAHRECLILNTIGHNMGVCSCTEPPYMGLSKREAGIEAARRLDSGEYPPGA